LLLVRIELESSLIGIVTVSPYRLIELKFMETRCPKKVNFLLLKKQHILSLMYLRFQMHLIENF